MGGGGALSLRPSCVVINGLGRQKDSRIFFLFCFPYNPTCFNFATLHLNILSSLISQLYRAAGAAAEKAFMGNCL